MDRGEVDQLLEAVQPDAGHPFAGGARHRHRAQRAGIAGATGDEVAAHDDPAADKGADEEIDIVQRRRCAEDVLGGAGRRRVIGQIDRQAGDRDEFCNDVDPAPGVHALGRRADLLGPGPHLVGHGDAEADDPQAQPGVDRAGDPRLRLTHEIEDEVDVRVGIGQPFARPHHAEEIHQHEFDRAAADLQAEGEGTGWIEPHRDRGLADPAAPRHVPQHQFLRLERPHDDRCSLRRQAGAAGDLGLGELAVLADQAEDGALVMGAQPGLVGSAHAVGDRRKVGGNAVGLGVHASSLRALRWRRPVDATVRRPISQDGARRPKRCIDPCRRQ